jgi:hypothetical protein
MSAIEPQAPLASDPDADRAQPRAVARAPNPAASPLDACLVLGGLAIIGLVLCGLFLVKVPQENLPIVAGLAGTLLGTVVGGYAAYRWGASDAMKRIASPTQSAG